MKRYSLYLIGIFLTIIFSSCSKPKCGQGAECDATTTFYVYNLTSDNIYIEDIEIQSGEKKYFMSSQHYDFAAEPSIYLKEYFGDTLSIKFSDSVEVHHFGLFTNGSMVYSPLEHNIYNRDSWQFGLVEEGFWTSWAVYTITEEDYQRALEQSKTLKANLSDNTTAAQIDELLDNYNNLGF